MTRSIQIILLYLLLLLPGVTFIHIWPLNSLMPDGGALLLASVLFSVALFQVASSRELQLSTLALLPLAMVASFGVSHLAADVALQTSLNWMIISLVLTALMVIVAEQLRASGINFQSVVAKGLLIAGVIYAIFALIQHYGIFAQLADLPAPEAGRLKGAWQQPNLTTSTLWVTFFGAAYVTRNNKNLAGILAFSFLIGAVVALAASRLNVLFVPFALAISVWLLCSNKTERFAQGRQLFAGILVIFFSLFVVPEISAPVERELAERGWIGEGIGVSLLDRDAADRPRVLEHLKIAGSLGGWSAKEWLVGKGAGQYGTFSYQQPVVPFRDAGGQGSWLHSHNLFSMIFVETGMLGLLMLMLIVGIVVYAVWQQRNTAWSVPAMGGLGIIFVHSMVEYPLWYPWYLVVTVLLAVPLFRPRKVSVTSPWLFSTAGVASLVVVAGLTWNLGGQARTILETAVGTDDSEMTYRRLALLANDGLLGPHAVLAKYRRFSPETTNLEWQLREVRRISEWRPLDLVQLREVTLLLMMGELEEACKKARETVLRFPAAGPIVLEKAALIEKIDEAELAQLSGCVEEALEVWNETVASMSEKNRNAQNTEERSYQN